VDAELRGDPGNVKRFALFVAWVLLAWPHAAAATDPGAGAAGPSAEDAAAARGVVESLHEVLSDCMREADELGFQGRYERILAALDETFDLPFMARAALGSTWKELSEEQLAEFTDLSRRLSATRYADNFDSDGGTRFETRSERPAARGTIEVLTELVQPKDRNVRFDYRLRKVQGRWRIIDIMLDEAISELAVRRSQYRSLIKREGYAHLVEAVEEKIEELSTE